MKKLLDEENNDNLQITALQDICHLSTGKQVSVAGRVTFQKSPDSVTVKGKEISKQEAILTDETASVRMVLWETDISKIISGQTYSLKKAIIRSNKDDNYITINKDTEIEQTNELIHRADEPIQNNNAIYTLCTPATGVQLIRRLIRCSKCFISIVNTNTNNKVIKCSECGMHQLKASCNKDMFVSAYYFVKPTKETLSILLKKEILKKICLTVDNNSDDQADQRFDALTDEDITEIILTAPVQLIYNENNIALDIEASVDE